MNTPKQEIISEIERFIAKSLEAHVVKVWADSYTNSDPFGYVILEKENNKIFWMKTQAHQLWEMWQTAKAKTVSEDLNYKQLYKLAIINSKTDKDKPNWAHVVSLGVGSGTAKEILRSFDIDPEATEMRNIIEAQQDYVINGKYLFEVEEDGIYIAEKKEDVVSYLLSCIDPRDAFGVGQDELPSLIKMLNLASEYIQKTQVIDEPSTFYDLYKIAATDKEREAQLLITYHGA